MAQRGRQVGLYNFIVVANILAGSAWFTVTTPPPVLADVPVIVLRKAATKTHVGIPRRLVVPRLSIDIKVATGSYNRATDSWTLGDDRAYYADASVPVNDNNGTTLIYGHATGAVFEALPRLPLHSVAKVYTREDVFSYKLASVKQVLPTDTSVFRETGKPQLVLQTCSGFWDSHRALFFFNLVGVSKR